MASGNHNQTNDPGDKVGDSGGVAVIDPAAIDASTSDGDGPGSDPGLGFKPDGTPRLRRAYRTRGSGAGGSSGTGKAKTSLDIKGLESLLVGIHLGLASWLQQPEMALTETEARELAEATARVAEFYPALIVSDRIMAFAALGMVCISIYGPRVALMTVHTPPRTAARPVPRAVNGATQEPSFADYPPAAPEEFH